MAPASRPPPACGRGGSYGGGSPSIITNRYPVHLPYLPPNRSIPPPFLRNFHHVAHAHQADYPPPRPSLHPDDCSRGAATVESRRRFLLFDSGVLRRSTWYLPLSYSACPSVFLPTRRLPRHPQLGHAASIAIAQPSPLSPDLHPGAACTVPRLASWPTPLRHNSCSQQPGSLVAALQPSSVYASPYLTDRPPPSVHHSPRTRHIYPTFPSSLCRPSTHPSPAA